MSRAPVFVVSTGRCGSTLVSNALRLNPAVLSISEFLSSLGPYAFSPAVDVRTQVAQPDPHVGWLLRHGLEYPEVLYPIGKGRYQRSQGVPPLLTTALMHLEPDPAVAEALYDQLIAELGTRLEQLPAAQGYRRTFDWLAHRYGAEMWVERSGGSLRLLPKIVASFPQARFVHVYRDGWATAQSMSRHHGFRFAVLVRRLTARLGTDPFLDPNRDWSDEAKHLDETLRSLLPDRFSATSFVNHDWRERDFALLWSGLTSTGTKTLAGLSPDRVCHLRYETMLAEPHSEMERLGSFLGASFDSDWVNAAAELVDPSRPSLPRDQGCAPPAARRWLQGGQDALIAHGLVSPSDPPFPATQELTDE